MNRFLKKGASGLLAALAFVVSANAQYQLILFDDFDTYADQTAFNTVWSSTASTLYSLDTTFGNGGQSVKLPSPASGSTGRYFRNLGGSYNGTDANPLVMSFDFYLDSAGANSNWAGARMYMEMRSYSGGAFNSGSLQQLLAIGVFNTSDDAYSGSRYQGRVAFGSTNWNTLDQDDGDPSNDPVRSTGWHNLAIEVMSTTVNFYVDGVFAETAPRGNLGLFDSVVLGSGLSDGTAPQETFWMDNFKVEIVPEPASMLILGAPLLALVRRKKSCR